MHLPTRIAQRMPKRRPGLPGIEFHDALVPRLKDGSYEIEVAHSVDKYASEEYFAQPKKQPIEVRGARFVLEPGTVHAVYPPAGSTGTFDQVVPHIVLDREPLPWERSIISNPDEQPTLPWVAVLVFAAGELPDDHEAVGSTEKRLASELTGTAPANLVLPELGEVLKDQQALTCQTIDVPGDVFARVAPLADELGLLVHVRRGEDAADGPEVAGDDRHAVVIGNRFPSPKGGQYVAHLVSLDGWYPKLPTPERTGDATTRLRMVSLHSWSFRTLPDLGPHFSMLVENMAAPGRADPDTLSFRLGGGYGTGRLDAAPARLRSGYVPVSYQLRSGEQTFAWYRGPFSPEPTQPLPDVMDRDQSADARLIYLERQGVFDISYAAAWTLGRALALADPGFGPDLMRWRTTMRRATGRTSGSTGGGHGSLIGGGALGRQNAAVLLEQGVADGLAAAVEAALTTGAGTTGAGTGPGFEPAVPGPPVDAVRSALSCSALPAALPAALLDTSESRTEPVLRWLRRLARLVPVPLEHLVPDPRMLPPESLRFFYLDRDWVLALVDGALSIGIVGSHDALLTRTLRTAMDNAIPQRASGFLLRSALVPAFPALRMRLSDGSTKLTALRRDRLAPDVELVLADGVLDSVVLAEPPQGLHFGYETGNDNVPYVQLRYLDGDRVGTPITGRMLTTFGSRLDKNRVLDVAGLATALVTGIRDGGGGAVRLGAGGLAIQMVKAAQQITISRKGT